MAPSAGSAAAWPWRRAVRGRSSLPTLNDVQHTQQRPSDNRRQVVALAVGLRVQPVARQVALERLVGLAVDEADEPVGADRLSDLGSARLVRLWAAVAALGVPPEVSSRTASCTFRMRFGSSATGTELLDT